MEGLVASTLGWFGTVGTFTAYVLIWRGWASPNAFCYAALNAVGGMLGAAGAFAYGAWPAVASNLVWSLIGIHGLASIAARKRRNSINYEPAPVDLALGAPEPVTLEAAELEITEIEAAETEAAEIEAAGLETTMIEGAELEAAELEAAELEAAELEAAELDELETAAQLIEPAEPLSDEELAIFNAITQPLPIIRIAQPQEQGSFHLTPELQ